MPRPTGLLGPVGLVWAYVILVELDLYLESFCNPIWKGYVLPGL